MRFWNKQLAFALFFFCSLQLKGQDLFSISNSINYANYLFTAGEYVLAAREFERIIFLDSTNLQAKFKLIKSYRLQGDYISGINRTTVFFKNYSSIPREITSDFGKMLLYEKHFDETDKFLNTNSNLTPENKLFFHLSSQMLQENYQSTEKLLDQNSTIEAGYISDYGKILNLEKNFNYKKPGISIAMSAIIPGSGKFYSGFWKDGLISFIFVSATAYQSYRGFNKNGIESVYGWIFGSLSAGFYIGNLYGSGKAANQHNVVFRNKIHKQVEDIFNSYD